MIFVVPNNFIAVDADSAAVNGSFNAVDLVAGYQRIGKYVEERSVGEIYLFNFYRLIPDFGGDPVVLNHFHIIFYFRYRRLKSVAYSECAGRPLGADFTVVIAVLLYPVNTVLMLLEIFIAQFKRDVLQDQHACCDTNRQTQNIDG